MPRQKGLRYKKKARYQNKKSAGDKYHKKLKQQKK